MPLTNNGSVLHMATMIGDGSLTNLAQGNAYLSLGDSATAFNASQNDLVASTNKLRKLCTSVSRVNGVVTFVTTFGTTEANFAIEEIGIHNASAAGYMAGRKVQSLGTKTSAFSVQITYSVTGAAG